MASPPSAASTHKLAPRCATLGSSPGSGWSEGNGGRWGASAQPRPAEGRGEGAVGAGLHCRPALPAQGAVCRSNVARQAGWPSRRRRTCVMVLGFPLPTGVGLCDGLGECVQLE